MAKGEFRSSVVLLVEDSPSDAELVIDALSRSKIASFEVTRAERLAGAQELLADRDFDCVLLDLDLPDADGLATVKTVRNLDPRLPIVVLTGRDDDEVGISALYAGAQDYLVKTRLNEGAIDRAILYAIERMKLDSAKSEFIARAAHELRTPLAVMVGLGELLGERYQALTKEQLEESLQTLYRQSKRARLLTDNLLDLSQIELLGPSAAAEPMDLAEAIENALGDAPPPEGVTVSLEPDLQVNVLAEQPRIEQVFVNLLSNAYKYGGNNVSISLADEGDSFQVATSDDGPGIPADLADKLFEPFSRGGNTSGVEGSGLGLAICKRILESFGGDLSYGPNEPTGARFIVELRKAP